DGRDTVTVPLIALAYGRSGDKGNVANIGIIARKPEYAAAIGSQVTESAVKSFLSYLVLGSVARFEMPGIHAFSFVCPRALGGGGTSALQLDSQGKAYAQKLLAMPVNVPKSWLPSLQNGPQGHLLKAQSRL